MHGCNSSPDFLFARVRMIWQSSDSFIFRHFNEPHVSYKSGPVCSSGSSIKICHALILFDHPSQGKLQPVTKVATPPALRNITLDRCYIPPHWKSNQQDFKVQTFQSNDWWRLKLFRVGWRIGRCKLPDGSGYLVVLDANSLLTKLILNRMEWIFLLERIFLTRTNDRMRSLQIEPAHGSIMWPITCLYLTELSVADNESYSTHRRGE